MTQHGEDALPNQPAEAPASPMTGSRVFIGVSVFLLLFLAGMAWYIHASRNARSAWRQEARAGVSASDAPNAIEPILDALDRVDWRAVSASEALLKRTATEGWSEESAQLIPLIANHQQVLSLAMRSAAIPQCRLPPTSDADASVPRPNIEEFRLLSFLLVANGRRLAATGHAEEAAQRLMDAAILGVRFTRPRAEATLTSHLIGMTAMELAIDALDDVISTAGEMPAEWRGSLAAQLAELDGSYYPIREAFRAEAGIYSRELAARSATPADLAEGLQLAGAVLPQGANTVEVAGSLHADALTVTGEQDRVWGVLDGILAMPPARQPRIDREWFAQASPNRLVQIQFAELTPLILREGILLARLRLERAALLPGGEALPADPFDGEPLRVAEGRIWSIGPDLRDDGGMVEYAPGKGLASGGDMIATRRASGQAPGLPHPAQPASLRP